MEVQIIAVVQKQIQINLEFVLRYGLILLVVDRDENRILHKKHQLTPAGAFLIGTKEVTRDTAKAHKLIHINKTEVKNEQRR